MQVLLDELQAPNAHKCTHTHAHTHTNTRTCDICKNVHVHHSIALLKNIKENELNKNTQV